MLAAIWDEKMSPRHCQVPFTLRLLHCISEHKLGSSFPTENPCPWCSAGICRLLECLLPLLLPSPQGSRCLSHLFPSLLPARQHLVLYPRVSPCGSAMSCGLELSGTGYAQQGALLSSPHRGHPAAPAATTLTPASNTVSIVNNFHWGVVHDWEIRSVSCWRENDRLPPWTVLRHVTGGVCTPARKRHKQPTLTLLTIYVHGWAPAGLPYHQAGVFTEPSQGQGKAIIHCFSKVGDDLIQ